MMENNSCRFCSAPLRKIFVDLGFSPLSNSFLKAEMLKEKEPVYPLCVYVCENCFLVQLPEFESPENIFKNYVYFSSFSETWLKHAENYCDMITKSFRFNKESLVVEIASNDGYLLQFFKKKGIPVLGIEPATNIANKANEKGILTIAKFFNSEIAQTLVDEKRQADLIIGNNVLAHVPSLNDFVKGMRMLLKEDGLITMEFPHLLQLIRNIQFDTIYHEHFSYFSFLTVQKVFSKQKLSIFDVEEIPTHGGSLRIYAKHYENDKFPINKRVELLLQKEKKFGLEQISTYQNFSVKVQEVKSKLLDFLISVKKERKKVVCYGAPAKGNTLLNYCGIGTDFIEYTVDRSMYKQGLFLPGIHIPIKNPDTIRETKPDYLLILPWNIQDEIIQQMSYIRDWKGKFVIPIPEVKVIS